MLENGLSLVRVMGGWGGGCGGGGGGIEGCVCVCVCVGGGCSRLYLREGLTGCTCAIHASHSFGFGGDSSVVRAPDS